MPCPSREWAMKRGSKSRGKTGQSAPRKEATLKRAHEKTAPGPRAAITALEAEVARLLNELRQSLQQQTATAKVLQVISSVSFDLQSVLDNLTEAAGRLCEADASAIWQPESDVLKLASIFGEISDEWLHYARKSDCHHFHYGVWTDNPRR